MTDELVFAMAYIAAFLMVTIGPVLFLDWVFGIVYRHSRRFRRRVNNAYRALTRR